MFKSGSKDSFSLSLKFARQSPSTPIIPHFGVYFSDTVILFRLRFVRMSLFILVLSLPLLAFPNGVILQLAIFPRINCGLIGKR
jgi:hypothetical protein